MDLILQKNLCPGIEAGTQDILSVTVGCIHSYQSLIAGVLAIIAALIAARPVWRQLGDIRLQTHAVKRENLSLRLAEASNSFQLAYESVETPLRNLMQSTHDPGGSPIEIDEHTSHSLLLTVQGKLDWFFQQDHGIESVAITESKRKVLASKLALEETLSDAYFTAANAQHDEHWSFTDDQWQELESKGQKARVEAAQMATDYATAWQKLRQTHQEWQKEMREKISSIDTQIANG